jgi:DNA-binding MarR family transcriptional regulator
MKQNRKAPVKDNPAHYAREIRENLNYLQGKFQFLLLNKAKEFGLRSPQLVVMMELKRSGTLSLGGLSEKIGLSKGTVSKIVDKLVKMGIVSRKITSGNRRKVEISIQRSYKNRTALKNEVLYAIMKGVDSARLRDILASLEQLKAIINKNMHIN